MGEVVVCTPFLSDLFHSQFTGGLIIPEKRMTPATGLEAPLKVLEIGLVVYNIGQSDSAPGVLNTITVTLQFANNTEFAGDNTQLIISGLKTTLTPAGTINITCMTGQCAHICEILFSVLQLCISC